MSDPAKLPVETPREWLRYAEGDLAVAEREMQAELPVYHIICFLCQGSAEKLLKAYLIAQGWSLEKTHDILQLLKKSIAYTPPLADLVTEAEVLNEYIVAGRYPGDISIEAIGKAEAEEALQAARRIRARIMELMQPDR